MPNFSLFYGTVYEWRVTKVSPFSVRKILEKIDKISPKLRFLPLARVKVPRPPFFMIDMETWDHKGVNCWISASSMVRFTSDASPNYHHFPLECFLIKQNLRKVDQIPPKLRFLALARVKVPWPPFFMIDIESWDHKCYTGKDFIQFYGTVSEWHITKVSPNL